MSRAYNIVIDSYVGAPGHGKYVVDVLNSTNKCFFSMLVTTVQFTGTVTNESHMPMNTSMSTTFISQSSENLKNSEPTCAHCFIDHVKNRQ